MIQHELTALFAAQGCPYTKQSRDD
jgi:hypothetical protein